MSMLLASIAFLSTTALHLSAPPSQPSSRIAKFFGRDVHQEKVLETGFRAMRIGEPGPVKRTVEAAFENVLLQARSASAAEADDAVDADALAVFDLAQFFDGGFAETRIV